MGDPYILEKDTLQVPQHPVSHWSQLLHQFSPPHPYLMFFTKCIPSWLRLEQEELLRFPFIISCYSYLFTDLHITQNRGLVFHASVFLLSLKGHFYTWNCFWIALFAASLMHKTEHLNINYSRSVQKILTIVSLGEKKVTLNILCLNTLPLASAAGLRHGTRFQRPLICSVGYYVLTLISTTSLPNTVFWAGAQAAPSQAIAHRLLPQL